MSQCVCHFLATVTVIDDMHVQCLGARTAVHGIGRVDQALRRACLSPAPVCNLRQVERGLRNAWGSHASTRSSRSAVQRPNLAPVNMHRHDAVRAQLSDLALTPCSFATLIVSHGEGRELAGTLLALVLRMPSVVAEVARLKLPPWHPLSLKGIMLEPQLGEVVLQEPDHQRKSVEPQVHLKTTSCRSV